MALSRKMALKYLEDELSQEELKDEMMTSMTQFRQCTLCERLFDCSEDDNLDYKFMEKHFIEMHGYKDEED